MMKLMNIFLAEKFKKINKEKNYDFRRKQKITDSKKILQKHKRYPTIYAMWIL